VTFALSHIGTPVTPRAERSAGAGPVALAPLGPRRNGPVRVCFLIDRLTRGGTETQVLALIRALDRRRVIPTLVLLDGIDAESRSLEPADCPVLRLGLRSLPKPAALAAAAGGAAGGAAESPPGTAAGYHGA